MIVVMKYALLTLSRLVSTLNRAGASGWTTDRILSCPKPINDHKDNHRWIIIQHTIQHSVNQHCDAKYTLLTCTTSLHDCQACCMLSHMSNRYAHRDTSIVNYHSYRRPQSSNSWAHRLPSFISLSIIRMNHLFSRPVRFFTRYSRVVLTRLLSLLL